VLINNIKGKISKIIEGVFSKDNNIGYTKFSSTFLKNSISSKIPVIKIIPKKRKNIFQNELKNIFSKNLIYVFIFVLNSIF
tara:strand:- start:271 stop:513 length:243 start_codon:yes stop_codon:yes gene_type:complete